MSRLPKKLIGAILVAVLVGVFFVDETAATSHDCSNGTVVPNPSQNSGLVADCDALLSGKDTLDPDDVLDWDDQVLIDNWDGVTATSTPQRVTRLELGDYTLTGSIPTELGDLSSLEYLDLSGNSLTGTIPTELGDLSNLTRLYLYFNLLSGSIPTELGDLSSLKWLHLRGNSLTGTIPTELGDLSSLETLVLNSNSLSGTIPTEMGDLTNLVLLELSGNPLGGTIPTELGDLSSLKWLRLRGNSLNGTIPTELGDLSSLEVLDLSGNSLSGAIPTELGDLSNLARLYLYCNLLSGTIPSELGDADALSILYIGGNRLTPPVPSSLANVTVYTSDSYCGTAFNSAPSFPTSQSIAENRVSGSTTGTAVIATDSHGDTITYSISGTDSASFTIDSATGQLKTSAPLDYETDDSYSVTVEATDPYGLSSSMSVTISVTDVLEAPGRPSAPTLTPGDPELSVSWSAPSNTGPAITDYDVQYRRTADSSWSDHAFTGTTTPTQITGLERSTEYEVQVRATNDEGTGYWSTSTTATTSANRAPSFTDGATTTRSVAENTASDQNIGGAVGATDADGDTLTYSISGTDAASFTIDSTSAQLKTSAPLDYETDDSYAVTIEASDGHGGTDSIAVTISVTAVNDAPMAVDDTAITAEDTAVDITVTANDTDAEGDPLSVTSVTAPNTGTAVITSGSTTTVTYTPGANFNGTDTFDYTLSDGTNTATGMVTVSVTAVNDAPTAVDDTVITAEDTAVDITVTANDTDAEGDPLSVTSVTAPSNGTAAITSGSTTTVTYSPGVNFNGTDTFDYTVSDGTDTATGTVTVRVGPPAKPTGLTGTGGDGQATLSWDDPSDSSISGYEHLLRAQIAKRTASDGGGSDEFGNSVAVDGDTMVAGAQYDDENGYYSGAAYVFTRQSGVWSQVAKLTAFNGGGGDEFGNSVAVDGDTVVVGAHNDDDNGSNSGAAYVFAKPGTGWATTTETAKLTAFDGAADDQFGYSVAVEGDTVVVSAYGDDDDGQGSGSAYVFVKPSTGWSSTSTAAKLTASDGDTNDRFGKSVAVDGDTVVVGAYRDDDNGSNSGSAYVFVKPETGWTSTSTAAKLTASDGDENDEFGHSVAVDGDMVVVGAWVDDDIGLYSGSVYVFEKPGSGGWVTATEGTKLTASDGATGDWFGGSVALDGDRMAVGASGDDDKGSRSGSVYVYTRLVRSVEPD